MSSLTALLSGSSFATSLVCGSSFWNLFGMSSLIISPLIHFDTIAHHCLVSQLSWQLFFSKLPNWRWAAQLPRWSLRSDCRSWSPRSSTLVARENIGERVEDVEDVEVNWSEFRWTLDDFGLSPRAWLTIFCIAACIFSKPNIFKSLAYRDARQVTNRIRALQWSSMHFWIKFISLHFLPPMPGNAVQSQLQQNMRKTMTLHSSYPVAGCLGKERFQLVQVPKWDCVRNVNCALSNLKQGANSRQGSKQSGSNKNCGVKLMKPKWLEHPLLLIVLWYSLQQAHYEQRTQGSVEKGLLCWHLLALSSSSTALGLLQRQLVTGYQLKGPSRGVAIS